MGVDSSSHLVLREKNTHKGTVVVHGIQKDLYQLQLTPLLQSPSGKVFKVLSNSGKSWADSSLRLFRNCYVFHCKPPGSRSPPCPQDTKRHVAQDTCGSAQAASVFKHQSSAPGRNLDLRAVCVYQTNILPSLAELYNSEVLKVFLSLDMCSS